MIALDELFEKSEGEVTFGMKRKPSKGWPKKIKLTYLNNSKRIIRFFDTATEAEFHIKTINWEKK